MVYLRQEPHFRRAHRILLGKEQLQMKHPLCHTAALSVPAPRVRPSLTLKGTSIRPLDGHVKVAQVVFVRCGRNPRSGVGDKPLGFLAMCIHTRQVLDVSSASDTISTCRP